MATSSASRDWISDVELGRLAVDVRELILHRVLVGVDPLVGGRQVRELPFEAVALDGEPSIAYDVPLG